MAQQFTNEGNEADAEAAAERINSEARDQVDQTQEDVKKMASEQPQKIEEFVNDERMGSAPRAKGIADKKLNERDSTKKDKKQKKFEVDLDNYMEFVDRVSSKLVISFTSTHASELLQSPPFSHHVIGDIAVATSPVITNAISNKESSKPLSLEQRAISNKTSDSVPNNASKPSSSSNKSKTISAISFIFLGS